MKFEMISATELSVNEMEAISGGRPSDLVKAANEVLATAAACAEFVGAFMTTAVSPGGILHAPDPWK